MGWKGTLRSVQAEIRRAEKRQIQRDKIRKAEQARDLVEEQNEYLEEIKAFHKVSAEKIDWDIFLKAKEPEAPVQTNSREIIASKKYENYEPNWFIRKLRLVQWRKNSLLKNIETSKAKDEKEFNILTARYQQDHTKWRRDKDLAERIKANDLDAYEQVLNTNSIFKDGVIKCSSLSISFKDNVLNLELDVLSENKILPNQLYSVTKTGKISEKDFPTTQYNQLYQDYVCSASLGAAKIMFGLFPISKILVHSMSDVLNTATGNLERQALLSILIPLESLQSLNLNQIDPSDCMKNFNHNMNFKNTEGLKPISQLKLGTGQAS